MNVLSTRVGGFVLLLLATAWVAPASATPAFARKYELNCSACHTAYPQLNKVGRDFKEAGYRFPTDGEKKLNQEISDFLQLEKHVPVSTVLIARPYDKKKSGDAKNRALHEVEVIVSGNVAKDWSGWFEIEAEDETDFNAEIGSAVLTYNRSPALNVQFGWAPIFWADPYGFLGDHFRLTRGHVGAIDQSFGGADVNAGLRAVRQNVGVYGRVGSGKVFYNLNWSGDAKNSEGTNASTVSGLVDVDITDNVMLGAFGVNGKNENTVTMIDRDYSRYGVQGQLQAGDGRLQAMYVSAKDDLASGVGNEKNNAYSVQGFWTFLDNTLRPTWVPLVRLDRYETNDGMDDYGEVALNLGYYFKQNIKGYVEYWDRYDTPAGEPKDHRWTLQVVAAF